ncbi:galectin-related protein B-like [Discoglossus pictus]
MTENDRCTNMVRYVGEIKGGMKQGMRITIMGEVDITPNRFTVGLLCGPKESDKDVAFLLAVNFHDRTVSRTAKCSGVWGAEEKTISYFPFVAGHNFKMELFCEHQQMRVLLDGQQLCDFTHRVQQIRTVTMLEVTGDIRLTKVV